MMRDVPSVHIAGPRTEIDRCATRIVLGMLALLLVASSSATRVGAEPNIQSVTNLVPPRLLVQDVDCLGLDHCLAVDLNGHILATEGGWRHWRVVARPIASALYEIDCSAKPLCVAVGSAGRIVISEDSGRSWILREPIPNSELLDVECPGPGLCLAVGKIDQFDGGERGLIIGSFDGGLGWEELDRSASEALVGVSCPSVDFCVAVGGDDDVLRSRSEGRSWHRLPLQERYADGRPLNIGPQAAIHCWEDERCMVLSSIEDDKGRGKISLVRLSDDGGEHWEERTVALEPDPLIELTCPSAELCVAVGAGDEIYVWWGESSMVKHVSVGVQPPAPRPRRIRDIDCLDREHCIASSTDGRMFIGDNLSHWVGTAGPEDKAWHRLWVPLVERD